MTFHSKHTRPMDNTQKPQRKIVQIQTIPPDEIATCSSLVALADDGTIWVREMQEKREWEKFPNIPQPENEPA